MTALSTEDSAALGDALRKALQDRYGFAEGRRQDLGVTADRLPAISAVMNELGLPSLLLPEAHGGCGGGVADLQRVQRELGRALVIAPWFDTVLAAQAVLQTGTPAQQDALLPALARGEAHVALAVDDAQQPAQARREGNGWRLQGTRSSVIHAGLADRLLVAALVAEGGEAWFLVDAKQAAVRHRPARLVDGSWSADVVLEGTDAELLVPPGQRQEAAAASLRLLSVTGRCAEALGAAEAALEMTVQHLRSRRQFGQALGEYQALRHRVADMYIALEQARSACALAREATAEDASGVAQRRAAQAQLVGSEAVTWILQQAIQLHGGMGMTEELAVGHYYRRMLVLNALAGGAPAALARLVHGGT